MNEQFSPFEKRRCRQATAKAIRRGELERQPCGTCGNQPAEAHHDDYSKPLDVMWLCRECHERLHCERGDYKYRGNGDRRPGGFATAKSHCKHGHAMTGDNIIYFRGKRHSCRECKYANTLERNRKRRSAITISENRVRQ